ncbi:acyl-CoA dehydrogenase family protein [Dietzia lutea]|uniref:Acyl-CoA dehydrogenase n=1 Tax=Dietzia lutea TaxID=546160 RepID=A0A2S1RA16_9ACTN|nr:acyl-CoA dehydrogenase family protein [Dietzia lutea]AWH93068.1 acyl-CoA dehydrogenase [Dietzia lutea]AWH93102.1 acyl-CoA dehydrogenase [Dietzia lutea]
MGFDEYLDVIRRFSQEELRPREGEVEREDRIPEDLVERMRELGLFAISIPRQYGGLGWSMTEQVRLTMEFTQAAAAYRSRFSSTIGLCSQALLDHGTDEQRSRWLPAMASGQCTAAFALTEPEAGSDAGSARTTATRDGDEYVINGHKRYITNAPIADLFLVYARTGGDGSAGMSGFLVPAGTPGLRVDPQKPMMGQRGSLSTEVHFEDCRVPAGALIGGVEGNGLRSALRGINSARTHVAATCVGQAMRLVEEATTYALGRHQFGQPIADFQSVENLLADSQAETLAGRALVLHCAQQFDVGPIPVPEISAAKYFCSEMACRVADRAVQVLGGAGYFSEHAISRFYRDVRLFRLFEGTSQIQQQQIARHLKSAHSG